MPYKIEEIRVLTLGTTAQDLELHYEGAIIENNSSTATVYFRDKEADGADCSSSNGFALGPGERLEHVITARTLSLVASAAGTDVRLMIVEQG